MQSYRSSDEEHPQPQADNDDEILTRPTESYDETNNLEDALAIRPTVHTAAEKMTMAQISALIILYFLTNCTANNRDPELSEPFASLFDYGIVNPSRELSIAVTYLFSCDLNDIAGSLRVEGNGYIIPGMAKRLGKMLGASIPPALVGLIIGFVLQAYKDEIDKNPVLQTLTSPPISRLFAAIISPLLYIPGDRLLKHLFPVPKYDYNQTPLLKWWQFLGNMGIRIYSAVSLWDLLRRNLSPHANAALHHAHFSAGAALIDQVYVNVLLRLAQRYHPWDGAFPFARPQELHTVLVDNHHDLDATPPASSHSINNANEVEEDVNVISDKPISKDLATYEESTRQLYKATHTPIRCDNVKSVMWYSTRFTMVVAVGFAVNVALSQLQDDKEKLTDLERMLLTAAVVTATAFTERFFEECLPWVLRKTAQVAVRCATSVSSCFSSLFHRFRGTGETEPLVPQPTANSNL